MSLPYLGCIPWTLVFLRWGIPSLDIPSWTWETLLIKVLLKLKCFHEKRASFPKGKKMFYWKIPMQLCTTHWHLLSCSPSFYLKSSFSRISESTVCLWEKAEASLTLSSLGAVCYPFMTASPAFQVVILTFSFTPVVSSGLEVTTPTFSSNKQVYKGRRKCLPVARLGSRSLSLCSYSGTHSSILN